MAWAEQKASGRWQGVYRVDRKPRSAGTFPTKKAAERAAWAAEDKARRDPSTIDPRDGKVTWGVYEPQWRARRRVEPGTAVREESRFDRVRARWGDVALNRIRREDIQDWVVELERDLSAWSVHHCYRLLSGSLKDAVAENRIGANPCVQITLPVLPEGNERYLTHAEFSRLAAVMEGKYHVLVLVLVGTGLRWGEAAGLHRHQVNLDRGTLTVAETYDDKLGEIKGYPKGRRQRTLEIPDWVLPELTAHLAAAPPAATCGVVHQRGGRCRSGLVFTSSSGTPIGYGNFRTRHWQRAVGAWRWRLPDGREYATPSEARKRKGGHLAEQVWSEGLAGIGEATIHDLRHTYASWNLQGEDALSLYELSVAMGHKSTKTTEGIYAHLTETARPRYRAAMAWPTTEPDAIQMPSDPSDGAAEVIDAGDRFRRSDGS